MSGFNFQSVPLVSHATHNHDTKRELHYIEKEALLSVEHLQLYNKLRLYVDDILSKKIEWKLSIISPQILNLTCNEKLSNNTNTKTSATSIQSKYKTTEFATNEMYLYLQKFATEPTIIRHITGSDFDLDISKISILEVVQWRVMSNIDNLSVEQFSNALKQSSIYISNETDIKGHLIGYISILENPIKDPWMLVKATIWALEKSIRYHRRNGTDSEIHQAIWLMDIRHLKYSTMAPLAVIKQVSHVMQYYYPERMYRTFVLFSPWVFRMIWKMVQNLATENTKAKIIFPGWYESEKYATFAKFIEKDKLLLKFGGTLDFEYSYEWELKKSIENNHYFPDNANKNNNVNNSNVKELDVEAKEG